ncbi:MAG: hypothetical protein PHR06_06430, partial [Candidatus Cloacimonetes bacterium]|nr:hypothetical protein [Candidatus Cloacimonadota bacterium]
IAFVLAALVIHFFNQIRFGAFMIVLLPPFLTFFFSDSREFIGKLLIAAVLMGVVNFMVSKRLGEF